MSARVPYTEHVLQEFSVSDTRRVPQSGHPSHIGSVVVACRAV